MGLSKIREVYIFCSWCPKQGIILDILFYYSLVYSHINQSMVIKPIRVVANKVLHIILAFKQDDHNNPEMSTHKLYRTLSVLKLHDVYNYNLL